MANISEKIKVDKEKKSYKKDKSVLPQVHEIEQKVNAVDYYNNLSDSDKLSFQREIQKKKLRESYAAYIQYIYGENYIMTKFHKTLCAICQNIVERVERGEQVRILLSTPPQVGKSKTLTEALPSWFIGRNPDLSCIITAYNADIAEKFGDRNRQKVKEFGKDIFGVEVSDSQDNKTLFQLKKHEGQIFSTGILGGLTSNPSALTIVDDPFKNGEEAESQDIRDRVEGVYWDSIETRTRKLGGAIIVIHTRWHEDDLIGRLAQKEGFIVVNFPTIWEKGIDKLLNRKIGEPLCPELGMTSEWALRTQKNAGSRVWNALYQGRPYVDGGNIIRRENIKFYKKYQLPPTFDEITLSCDLSFGGVKTTNDPNCLVVWGRVGANHYLLKQINKKCGFQETINDIKMLCSQFPTMRKKIIEKKANGNATIELLNQHIAGVIPFDPLSNSKETRLKLVAPYFESGNIYLPDESVDKDSEEIVSQLLKFPNVGHDEYVDTTSQYLLEYSYKNDGSRVGTDGRYALYSKAIRGFRA